MNGSSLYSKKDKVLAVPMSDEQKEELRQFAEAKRMSMAQAARIIIADFFDNNLQKKQVNRKDKAS